MNLKIKDLCELYSAGYRHGHHETVESIYCDISHEDAEELTEVVTEWLVENGHEEGE